MEILRGDRIKLERIRAGLKQADLAEKLNISKGHLSFVENGRRESYKVRVLATEFFQQLNQEKSGS